jgi:diguanylate cyclase (GGDEF)-like protein/PAS domain S-box-containing protein
VNSTEEIVLGVLNESAPMGLIAIDHLGVIVYANASAHRIFGLEDLIGVPSLSLVHPDSLGVMIQTTIEYADGPKIAVPSTFDLLHSSGDYIPVEMWVQQSFDEGPISFLIALRDATAEKCYDRYIMAVHHHEPVETSTQLLVRYLDAKAPAADHAVLWDWDGSRFRSGVSARIPIELLLVDQFLPNKLRSSGAGNDLTDGDAELEYEWVDCALGAGHQLFELDRKDPYVQYDAVISYAYETGCQRVRCAVVSLSPHAIPIGAGSKLASERAAQSSGLAIIHFENAERLLRDAVSDSLTGLLNRRGLFAVLTTQSAERCGAKSIVLLDLDGFKRINDRFGHSVGDSVLIEVARRLTRLVGSDRLVARLGGDEFALLVDETQLSAVTDVLYETIAEPMVIDGMQMSVGVSFGIANLDQEAPDIEAVFREADERMYQQKGKRRVERRTRGRKSIAEHTFVG